MEDRRLIPNAVGKEIKFHSSSSFQDEYFYHIELSDGNTYALVSKSPIEVYREEELEE
jgi:hypothetical protein